MPPPPSACSWSSPTGSIPSNDHNSPCWSLGRDMHQGGVAWMCGGPALGEAVALGILAKCKGIGKRRRLFTGLFSHCENATPKIYQGIKG